MLKVTMIIDNHIAAPHSPEEFVRRWVLKTDTVFKVVDMIVEQESYFGKLEEPK